MFEFVDSQCSHKVEETKGCEIACRKDPELATMATDYINY